MGILTLILFLLLVLIVILIIQMRKVISCTIEEKDRLSDLLFQLEPILQKLSESTEQAAENSEIQETVIPEIQETESTMSTQTATPPLNNPLPVPPALPEINEITPPEPKPENAPRRNLEKIIGENLMSKIGVLALIIGIGFFVKFAIDNNWINEVGRTIIGLATGIVLVGIAYPLRKHYRNFSSVLAGGGFAICFVTVAVAHNYYSLFSSGTALAILITLTVTIICIAIKFDRRELAMTGFIGGFVAPFLSISETGSSLMLFSYITILNAGIFLITLKRNWWELAGIGNLLTWTVVLIYYLTDSITSNDSAIMLFFSTLFVILFSIPLATVLSRDTKHSVLFLFLLLTAAVNFFSYLFFGIEFISNIPLMCRVKGLIPFVDGAINLLLFYRFYSKTNDNIMQNLLLGASAVSAVLTIPVQFSNPSVITVSFAVLTLVFVGVCSLTHRKLFAITALLLALIDIQMLISHQPTSIHAGISYSDVWTYVLSGMCYIAIACVISKKWNTFLCYGKEVRRVAYCVSLWAGIVMICIASYLLISLILGHKTAMTATMTTAMTAFLLVSLYGRNSGYVGWLLPAVGTLLFLLWCKPYSQPTVANEIIQWIGALLYIAVISIQGNRIFRHPKLMGPFRRNGFAVYFSLSASLFTVTAIELMLRSTDLTRYYSAGFSIGLIICGSMLMAAGIRYRSRVVRITGIAIFGLLLLKLVAYDIWGLPMVGRIIVFIFLGAVLLALSFLYQRLRENIFGEDDR